MVPDIPEPQSVFGPIWRPVNIVRFSMIDGRQTIQNLTKLVCTNYQFAPRYFAVVGGMFNSLHGPQPFQSNVEIPGAAGDDDAFEKADSAVKAFELEWSHKVVAPNSQPPPMWPTSMFPLYPGLKLS